MGLKDDLSPDGARRGSPDDGDGATRRSELLERGATFSVYTRFRSGRLALLRRASSEAALSFAVKARAERFHDRDAIFVVCDRTGEVIDPAPTSKSPKGSAPTASAGDEARSSVPRVPAPEPVDSDEVRSRGSEGPLPSHSIEAPDEVRSHGFDPRAALPDDLVRRLRACLAQGDELSRALAQRVGELRLQFEQVRAKCAEIRQISARFGARPRWSDAEPRPRWSDAQRPRRWSDSEPPPKWSDSEPPSRHSSSPPTAGEAAPS